MSAAAMPATPRACLLLLPLLGFASLLLLQFGQAAGVYEFGQTCQNNRSCSNLANTRCNDVGHCQCLEGYSHMNETACGKAQGDRCDNGHCDANNTKCYHNICTCPPTFTPNYNLTFCYKKPEKFGDLCNETSECPVFGDGRLCRHGRCGCLDDFGFSKEDNTCKYKIDEIGKECNDNQICYLERDGDNQHAKCIDGVCKCPGKLSKDKQSCSGGATFVLSTSALLVMLAKALS